LGCELAVAECDLVIYRYLVVIDRPRKIAKGARKRQRRPRHIQDQHCRRLRTRLVPYVRPLYAMPT